MEYQLQVLKCKPEPLTDEEKELVASSKTIDDMLPRETAESQLKRLEKIMEGLSGASTEEEEVDEDIQSAVDID